MANYAGMKVTIMGLGLNGGGLESARYLALNGAECTITDMKDQKTLAPSIEQLQALSGPHHPFRFVLGKHEIDDFTRADMVVKNPAVRPDSPYLAGACRIETDLSLFLEALRGIPIRLIAVTGSKGKSITASAVHWVLTKAREKALLKGRAFLGGNIAVSPLSFLDQLSAGDDVVLELSSWQLGDLKGRGLLKPRIAILTSIMPDHQDRYNSMEDYVNDKRIIYQGQDKEDATIASTDDHWGKSFLAESPGRPIPYSAEGISILPELLVPGHHNKKNCLAAALALIDLGLPLPFVRESLGTFPGIEHRLEFFHEKEGIYYYNDTTATIPEAAAAAVEAFTGNNNAKEKNCLILISGGTDKNLDFSPFVKAIKAARANSADLLIILLSGTGSDKLIPLLQEAAIPFHGPYNNIIDAAQTAMELGHKAIKQGIDKVNAVLSPGCTSFGMFKNEFDRGNQWKKAVSRP